MDDKVIDFSKKTLGSIIAENQAKEQYLEDHPREYTILMGRDVMRDMQAFVDSVSKSEAFSGKNFYVVLVINGDRVLHEPKFQFLPPRYSCPTPVFKQAVWKYHSASASLEYLWNIPSKERYYHILKHKNWYLSQKNWKSQTETVLFMESGQLLKWVKKECGELPDAIIKITPKEEPSE